MKDKNLIEGIVKGDKKSEEILLNKYNDRISFIVHSKLNNREITSDIIQEIKMGIILSIRKGNFLEDGIQNITLGAYIYGITNNKINDYYKKLYKDEKLKSDFKDDINIQHTDNSLDRKELRNYLKKSLKQLKHKYREVIYLKYFEELSIDEISQKIDVPQRRVSERLNYAIKLLRKELDKTNIFAKGDF